MDFDEWKMRVDTICLNMMGMLPDELPDWDFWSAWDSGMTPKEAYDEFFDFAQNYD